MGLLTNFANSLGVGGGVNFDAQLENELFGLQNKGLLGRKNNKMYFTDLSRPRYITPQGMQEPQVAKVKKQSMPDVEVYIDPQSVKVSKKVLFNKKQTKGGWVLQFWGHDLTTLSVNMKSGFYGYTKGQNILTMSYDALKPFDLKGNWGKQQLGAVAVDPLKVFQKLKNNAYTKRFDESYPSTGFPLITLVYEGTPYTGFFNNFDYDISADNPFNINFSFNFTIVPTNNKLMFEQAMQNASRILTTGLNSSDVANLTLFSASAITNPNGTAQKLFQGGVDWALKTMESSLNDLTGNLGVESLFDDLFPSKEELN